MNTPNSENVIDWTPPDAFPLGRFEGNAVDVGRAHGRTFGDQVMGSIRVHRGSIEKTGLAWKDALAWAEKGRTLMHLIDPRLAQELDGMAEGAEVDRNEIYAINFRVALSRIGAQATPERETPECTVAVALGSVTENGHTLLAQNWDQNSDLQANLVVIEQKMPGQPTLLFVTEAGRLFLHGMNDAGVGIVGSALRCDTPTMPERSGASTGDRRRALRHTSVAAVHRTIIDIAHGSAANHLVASATGEAVDIELVPDDSFAIEPEDGILAHSNHFMHPRAKETVKDMIIESHPSTVHRQSQLRDALKAKAGRIRISDVQDALRDHYGYPTSVCTHPQTKPEGGSSHTLSSTVIDLNDKKILVTPGPVCKGKTTEYRFS